MRVLSLTHTTPWPLALKANRRPDGVAVEAKDLTLGDDLEANVTTALEAAEAAGKGPVSEAVVADVEANLGIVGHQVTDDEAAAVLRIIMARCPRFEGLYFYSGNKENVAAYDRVLAQAEFAAIRAKTTLYIKTERSPVLAKLRGLKVSASASASASGAAGLSPAQASRAARRAARAAERAEKEGARHAARAAGRRERVGGQLSGAALAFTDVSILSPQMGCRDAGVFDAVDARDIGPGSVVKTSGASVSLPYVSTMETREIGAVPELASMSHELSLAVVPTRRARRDGAGTIRPGDEAATRLALAAFEAVKDEPSCLASIYLASNTN